MDDLKKEQSCKGKHIFKSFNLSFNHIDRISKFMHYPTFELDRDDRCRFGTNREFRRQFLPLISLSKLAKLFIISLTDILAKNIESFNLTDTLAKTQNICKLVHFYVHFYKYKTKPESGKKGLQIPMEGKTDSRLT